MSQDIDDPGPARAAGVTLDDEQDLDVDHERLRALAERALDHFHVPRDAHLAITLVDEQRIAELKEQAFGIHAATDVLSWPMDSIEHPSPGPLVLGDVVICVGVARAQAAALGHSPDEELAHLVVHGILHVLGRDHADPASERAMFAEEARALGAIMKASV